MADKIKVSQLTVGDSIAIQEEDGYSAYRLVQHNYNDGIALLLRETVVDQVQWALSSSATTYAGSNLDNWQTNTWYPSQPDETKRLLSDVSYPIISSTSNSGQGSVTRKACTISVGELSYQYDSYHGSLLDYRPVNIGTAYWTRQLQNSSYAFEYDANASMGTRSVASSSGVRPCIGVNESKVLAEKNESTGFYYLSNSFIPPEHLYLDGFEADIADAQPERTIKFSWNAATGDVEDYYILQNNITETGGGKAYYTTDTSITVSSPAHGYKTSDLYQRVLPKGETQYQLCGTRSISTRNSNIQYYGEDGLWYLAKPKYYDNEFWNDNPNAMYHYDENGTHLLYGSK